MKLQTIVPLFIGLFIMGCSTDVSERAELLKNNVVAISVQGQEGAQSGFGLITGQQRSSLYITTAEHVVAQADAIEISFNNMGEAKPATLVFADAVNDVAVLTVNNPPRFTWYKNCLGSGQPGDDVGFIGRNDTWDITRGKEIGSIKGFGLNIINCYLPTVVVGTSGAPLVHDSGFIGMIVSDESTATQAVDMNTISKLLKQEQSNYFMLENTGFNSGAIETNPGLSALEKDVDGFTLADETGTIKSYQQYLNQHENGKFRKQAQKRIAELEQNAKLKEEEDLWIKTKSRHSIKAYEAYLQKYEGKNGRFVRDAKDGIANLKLTAKQAEEELRPSKSQNSVKEVETPINKNVTAISDQDGNKYRTMVMKDGKRWMTQNLNLKVDNSWCYEEDPSNCAKYGRLYTWEAAKKACAELGDGWKLPTDDEWQNMVDKYGGAKYGNAKDEGKAAYEALYGSGISGFAAQLGGWRNSFGYFLSAGASGSYWSSSPSGSSRAWSYYFHRDSGRLYRFDNGRDSGHSVRCLQDL